MYCSPTTLVKWSSDKAEVALTGMHCKSWSCPECAERMKAALRRKIQDGNPDTFLTLTCNPKRYRDPAEARAKMAVAWHKLIQQVRRVWGYETVPYAVVVEQTEEGWPHFHVAMRVKWIGQKWLSRQWEKYSGAPIVDIRRVKSRRGIARYLAKYLTKDPAAWPHKRRAWFGRHWPRVIDKRPKLFSEFEGHWQRVDCSFTDACRVLLPTRFTTLYSDGKILYAGDLEIMRVDESAMLAALLERSKMMIRKEKKP